jgi:chemotaxis protein methyltransferase CheR
MRHPSPTTIPPPISVPEGLPLLMRDLIHERIGMYFDAARLDILLEKITPLARARLCRSFMDYYYILKYGENEQAEWQRVMDALSVQETYFWREMDQVNALTKVVVPELFSKGAARLRIWSAACATGEEPYTLAMSLIEAGHRNLPIEIVATDASRAALDKAQAGLFRERSFRTLPPELQAKYFRREANGWRIVPEIMKRIHFNRVNLVVKNDVAQYAAVPVIFCRNVFIYFTPEVIRRTVQWMGEQMPDQGYLFIGSSESLLKLNTDFDLQQIGGAFVYGRNARASELGKAGLK